MRSREGLKDKDCMITFTDVMTKPELILISTCTDQSQPSLHHLCIPHPSPPLLNMHFSSFPESSGNFTV